MYNKLSYLNCYFITNLFFVNLSIYYNLLFFKYFFIGNLSCLLFDAIAYKLVIFSKNQISSQSYRWFFIHFIFNFFISILTFDDIKYCIFNLSTCSTNEWFSGDIVYALTTSLHLYHTMFFKLNYTDIIHHISTALLSTPLIIFYHRYHTAVVAIFFMSGLPGMIDYFLLWLVKMGYLNSIVEKKIFFIISIYIRSSGCVACSTLQLGFLNIYNQLSYIELFSVIWITFITYFNGLYYMHDTVANYYSKYHDKLLDNIY